MKRTALTTLLVLAAALPAAAQVHFGLTAGWYTPYSSTKDYANSGYDGGIVLGFGAPLVPVSFRVDATYGELPGKNVAVTGGTVKSDFSVYGASGNVVWNVIGATLPTKVYLIGGVGYYKVEQKYSFNGTPPVPNVSKSAFGYNAGIGFKFTLFFIEARYTSISNGINTEAYTFTPGSKALTVIPINVGVMF
jgi:hypothetical protein